MSLAHILWQLGFSPSFIFQFTACAWPAWVKQAYPKEAGQMLEHAITSLTRRKEAAGEEGERMRETLNQAVVTPAFFKKLPWSV